MTQSLVTFEIDDGLGRLRLNRPSAMNAVSPAFVTDLRAAIGAAGRAGAGALLLTAEGPNFCVGADVKHLANVLDELPAELSAIADDFHAALADLAGLSIPIIAAVQGHAVGAGFGLAMMADVIFAADDARFSTGYARLGLSADAGVSWSLTRALGLRRARSLLLTARQITADDAHSMGLIDQVLPAPLLSKAAEDAALAFTRGPTPAYEAIKMLTAEAEMAEDFARHLTRERDSVVRLADHPQVRAAILSLVNR